MKRLEVSLSNLVRLSCITAAIIDHTPGAPALEWRLLFNVRAAITVTYMTLNRRERQSIQMTHMRRPIRANVGYEELNYAKLYDERQRGRDAVPRESLSMKARREAVSVKME
jgi:hypothetical protein